MIDQLDNISLKLNTVEIFMLILLDIFYLTIKSTMFTPKYFLNVIPTFNLKPFVLYNCTGTRQNYILNIFHGQLNVIETHILFI